MGGTMKAWKVGGKVEGSYCGSRFTGTVVSERVAYATGYSVTIDTDGEFKVFGEHPRPNIMLYVHLDGTDYSDGDNYVRSL